MRDLRPLFDPRSVAIVGASSDPLKWGYGLSRGALKGAHRRDVYLVNRGGGEILPDAEFFTVLWMSESFAEAVFDFQDAANDFVATLDRGERVALLPLGDDEAAAVLAPIPPEQRGECWWVVLRDGTPVPGDRGGGVVLLAELRLTSPLAKVFGWLRLSGVVDALDRLVARHRGRLGRFVPDGAAPRRFP